MFFVDMLDLVMETASAAFIDVTTFVGLALLIFGVINYKMKGGLIDFIGRKKRWQPVIGALLGLTPGCGGAILVMPLFVKRTVGLGTVVAALIATAGDSAFVLIAKDLRAFVVLGVVSLVVGIVAGYIVDYFRIGEKFIAKAKKMDVKYSNDCKKREDYPIQHFGHERGDEIDMILHGKSKHHQDFGTMGYRITHHGYLFYWTFLIVGLVFGIMNLLSMSITDKFWLDFILYFGGAGTLLSIILMIAGKKFFSDDTHEEVELKLGSFKETLIHSAEETAFVGVWVFVAYLAFELLTLVFGGGESLFVVTGFASILIASAVGMIPGCGPQIIFVSLYLKGMFPFAALLACGISQDGDALFPLLAMNKRAALVVTLITTVVAVIVGGVWYLVL